MKYVISIIILVFFCSISYAEEQKCMQMPQDSFAKIVVELESCRVKSDELENYSSQIEEFKTQNKLFKEREELFLQKEELYKSIIELQKQEIAAANKAMEEYRNHIKFVQESYQQMLKEQKPNPVMEFFKSIVTMGAGVAFGYGFAR